MNSQRIAQLVWPGVLTALTGMYIYWAAQNQLVSSRPSVPGKLDVPDPIPSPGTNTLHSRIWEDPLSTAYQHWKDTRDKNPPELRLAMDSDVHEACTKAAGEMPRSHFSVEPGVFSSDKQRAEMRVRFASLAKESPVLCLAVCLPGEPYAEDKERRMRTRYAVESALAEANYSLEFSRRMSYVVPKIFVRAPGDGWQEREIVVPIKLYKSRSLDGEKSQVLVLWIDESELGQKPLLAVHRILHAVFCQVDCIDRKRLQVAMIGPSTSDMLGTIEKECEEFNNIKGAKNHWKFAAYAKESVCLQHGFSPFYRVSFGQSTEQPVPIFSPRATADLLGSAFENNPLARLYRVVGTDEFLADELRQELQIRGALSGKVVLITENDSRYGQNFRKAFKNQIPDWESKLLMFGMLRGIDGKLPGDDGEFQPAVKESKPSPGSPWSSNAVLNDRRPEGRSQFDYLRRLGTQIKDRVQGERVSAIGVVGTDVYDKLLVLRALRPQFPDAVFFTTDMDAIFTDANERPYTRGLIVASHFGLTLNDSLQAKTAAFRDSYQTSTFLATKLAVEDGLQRLRVPRDSRDADSEALNSLMRRWFHSRVRHENLAALRFLVGRKDAQLLTVLQDSLAIQVHPIATNRSDDWHLVSVAGILVLAIGVGWLVTHRDSLSVGSRPIDDDQAGGRQPHPPKPGAGGPVSRPSSLSDWLIVAGYAATLLSGVSLLVAAGWVVGSGRDSASPLGAFSTWSRNVLYAVGGIVAWFAFGWLLLKFRRTLLALKDGGEAHCADQDVAGNFARDNFRGIHLVQCSLLALVTIYAGILFVHGLFSVQTVVFLIMGGCLLAVAWYFRSAFKVDSTHLGLLFELGPGQSIGAAVAAQGVLTLLVAPSAWAGGPMTGWRPLSNSRGEFTRFIDGTCEAYALGAVGVLLATLVYAHWWCLAIANADRKRVAEWFQGKDSANAQPAVTSEASSGWNFRDEYRVMWLVGKLTSVTSRLIPVVMALLLLIVLTYHPLISPNAMPTGLLLTMSVGMFVAIGTPLWLRLHFEAKRRRVLEEIDAVRQHYESEPNYIADAEVPQRSRNRRNAPAVNAMLQPSGAVAVANETEQKSKFEIVRELKLLDIRKQQISGLSEGVFQSWNEAPISWLLGGGTLLALVDWWIRAFTVAT